MRQRMLAVLGTSDPDAEIEAAAELVGGAIARAGAVVVCGGLGGVMAAACRGAHAAGGLTVGLLPGLDPAAANSWVTVAIPTGLGELRNGLIVRACTAAVALGRGYGTLSEIALALRAGKPVAGWRTWDVEGLTVAGSPQEAAALAIAALGHGSPG